MRKVNVQAGNFDAGAEIQALSVPGSGAVVSFCGLVREQGAAARLSALELEHYPGMTERALNTIVDEAAQRWSLLAVTVIHRFGLLKASEQIVFVGVSSPHRGEAFAAAEYIMDYLKTRAPFWKREWVGGLPGDWVEAKESDEVRADRWEVPADRPD